MKRKRVKRNEPHLAFIRRLGCLICQMPAEAAHVRYSDAKAGKVNPGMSRKEDAWAVPLCPKHHRTGADAQHGGGEREWWERQGIDPLPIAKALYEASGDYEQACAILRGIQEARER